MLSDLGDVLSSQLTSDAAAERGRYVYGLRDPRTGLIRYVGRTARLIARKKQHESMAAAKPGSRLCMWFQEMANDGVKPEFVVLFAAFGLQVDYAVSKQEAAIIRFFVDHGCDLVNEFHHPHRKEWRRRTRKSA